MLFDMVNPDPFRIHIHVGQHFQCPFSATHFILQVRCMNQNQLIIFDGLLDLCFENLFFVLSGFVKTDFAYTQYSRFLIKLRHVLEHFAAEFRVLCFFGVHGNPAVMLDAIFGGTRWFEFTDLVKVIYKRFRIQTVKAGPECRFRNGNYAGHGHAFVVLCCTGDRVIMRLNDLHNRLTDKI